MQTNILHLSCDLLGRITLKSKNSVLIYSIYMNTVDTSLYLKIYKCSKTYSTCTVEDKTSEILTNVFLLVCICELLDKQDCATMN